MLEGIEHVIEFVGQKRAMGGLWDETCMKAFQVLTRGWPLRPAEGAEDFTRQAAFTLAEDAFEAVEHIFAIFVAAAGDKAVAVEVVQCARCRRFGDRFVLYHGNEKLEEDRPVRAEEMENMAATGLVQRNIVVGSEAPEELKSFGVFERRDFADIKIIDGGEEAKAADDGFQGDKAGDERKGGGGAEFVPSRAKPV